MDRSYPYSRRLLSRARLRKRMAAVAAAGVVAATAAFMLTWTPDPISAAAPAPSLPVISLDDAFGAGEPVRPGVRRIYPYSVVPGGVSGQAELKRIIRTDSVVAAHYASFDADKARAVVVDKPRAVHVSYRKGDKVYWTAHKVMLAPGETLLSDGSSEMRARCANRISEIAQYPVEAHHPTMAELDQPVELVEGEEYALGPDGMPVAMGSDEAIGRQSGMRFALRGGSGAGGGGGGAGASADAKLASLSSSSAGMGPVMTMGLSGSSSSLGSRPRPASRLATAPATTPATTPATEPGAEAATPSGSEPVVDTGSGDSSGSSGSPAPSSESTTAPQPSGTTPTPDSPAVDPRPAPVPVAEQPAPLPLLPSGPGPVKDPAGPKPVPDQLPPQNVGQPPPTEVPEPGSLWLFGLALAAMSVLRRARGLKSFAQAGIFSPAATAGRARNASTAAITCGKSRMPTSSPAS